MITLRVLGGARLDKDGDRVHGEPVQRHRVALLALLALAPEARLPREKVLALLWPERDPRSARHLLNVAVHVLRKALGSEVIRSEGDDLRLDLTRIDCDALAFRDAVARGDSDTGVALYAGAFMDGFFLDDAPEFDQWQESRRRELEADHLDALGTRATEAEDAGDVNEAIACLRRLVRERPTDASAMLRLMRVFEAHGDVAAALAVSVDHARAMAEMFDAEPSPEVERLADRMREDPRPPRTDLPPRNDLGPSPPDGRASSRSVSFQHADGAGHPHRGSGSAARVSSASPQRGPGGTRRRIPWGIAVAAALLLLGLPVAFRTLVPGPSRVVSEASVAVLPFMDMSPARDHAYFSDGLTEELLNALAQTPGLRVAARSSSFQFRGDGLDIQSVGRRLGVAAVVEGSVRVDDDRLRVTTQLIDTESGYHLWSAQYDRAMQDVFSVQEEIARAVATALSAELAGRLPDTMVTATTTNPAAYALYLRGRHAWRQRTEDGMRGALEAFEEAVVLDPTYAAAYAGLADTWQLLPDYASVPSGVGLARARTAALRAVALDSTLAEAHVSLAALLDDYDRDRAGAEAAYRRAIELNPGYATARHWLGIHLADDGRHEEALQQIEYARRLDPLSEIVNTAVGAVRYFARDYDGAEAEYRSVLDRQPDFALAWALLGRVQLVAGRTDDAVASLERSVRLSGGDPSHRAVYAAALAATGRTAEAYAIVDDVRSPHPDGYVPYCELASAYLRLGEDEEALTLFELAWERRDPALKHIRVEPLYERIRDHPDFVALMRRAGFDV